MAPWDLETPREVDTVQGACVILRREALDQVGLLDEDYFMYTEEVDLCYRLRQDGWQIYWAPQAAVVHYGGQSTRQMPAEMFLRLYESKLLYFRKRHGPWAARLYKLILLAAALARLLVSPLARLERPPQREQHLSPSTGLSLRQAQCRPEFIEGLRACTEPCPERSRKSSRSGRLWRATTAGW